MTPTVHGRRLSETGPVRDTQALARRPSHGKSAAYPNTPEERRAAALTCADRVTDADDLDELLTVLGLA